MHGRNKRAASHHALALIALGCLGSSFAAFPALAQGAGGKGVSVTVNPTTGYSVINSKTIGVPRGTTVGPSGGVPSVTVRPAGGLSQSLPAGIEITGLRQDAQTLRGNLGARINAGTGALRGAATRCLTSFRCNAAMAIGSAGLQQLLDGVGWIIDEGSKPISKELPPVYPPHDGQPFQFSNNSGSRSSWECPSTIGETMTDVRGNAYAYTGGGCNTIGAGDNTQYSWMGCELEYVGRPLSYIRPFGTGGGSSCFYGGDVPERETVPLTPGEIASTIETNYNPEPSDWTWLSGGLDFNSPDVTIEITDLPVLDGSNEPNFITAADGTSRGTFNIYTPTVTGNNTSKPEIEVRDQQTETSYDEQGNPTGTSTSTGTMTPNPGGSPSSPDIEIPTDCDFMPTVCRFIDWFTEPDTQPDPDQEIKDLVQVYEDGGREVSVGPESGTCPPPRTIELSLVPSVEFSFQPFCDLATAVRFWLLAIASFGAAYMTVRSI